MSTIDLYKVTLSNLQKDYDDLKAKARALETQLVAFSNPKDKPIAELEQEGAIMDHILAYYHEDTREDIPTWLYMQLEAIRLQSYIRGRQDAKKV